MKCKQEDKMASPDQNSIANELLQTISNAKFTQVLCLLNPEFALTINHFKRIKDIAIVATGSTLKSVLQNLANPSLQGYLTFLDALNHNWQVRLGTR